MAETLIGTVVAPDVGVKLAVAKFETHVDDDGKTLLYPDGKNVQPPLRVRFIPGIPRHLIYPEDTIEVVDAGGKNFFSGEKNKPSSQYITLVKETLPDGSQTFRAFPIDASFTFTRKKPELRNSSADAQVDLFEKLEQYGERLTAAGLLRQKLAQQKGEEDEEKVGPQIGVARQSKGSRIVRPARQAAAMRAEAAEDEEPQDEDEFGTFGKKDFAEADNDFADPAAIVDDVVKELGGAEDDGAIDLEDAGRTFDVFGGEANADEIAIDYDAMNEVGDDAGDAGDYPQDEETAARAGLDEDDVVVGGAVVENKPMGEEDVDLDVDVEDAAEYTKVIMELVAKAGNKGEAASGTKRARDSKPKEEEAEEPPDAKRPRLEANDQVGEFRQRLARLLASHGGRINQKTFFTEFPYKKDTPERHISVRLLGQMTTQLPDGVFVAKKTK